MTEDSTIQGRSFWVPFGIRFVLFTAIGLVVYRSALLGPFISDDAAYITSNPYMQAPWWILLREVLNPVGDMRIYMTGNFAPIHGLAHAIEWHWWGNQTVGYHLVNVVLHALNATLLVTLLQASKVPRSTAIVLGALFLLHPANVEAVAWISQLKSLLAMGFSLTALLAFRRYPLASTMLFTCALLSKVTALFAFPMAAAFFWAWRAEGHASTRHGISLALWAAIFIAYAPAQFSAFAAIGEIYATPYPDTLTHLRSMGAIGARYLLMAATGYGTSAFHEPEPVYSNLDPWWIASILVAPLLVWRIAASLRNHREEAAWWIGAAVSFAPISQIFPFYFGMGDRYLYFILPGLLGGAVLAFRSLVPGAKSTEPPQASPRRMALGLSRAAFVVGLVLIAVFAHHAQMRATLWQGLQYLDRDAISNYPNGSTALYTAAVDAVSEGDHDRTVDLLRAAADRGHFFIQPFRTGHFKPLFSNRRYNKLMRDVEARRIAFAHERGFHTQRQLMEVARSHEKRREYDEAIEFIERALRKRGPYRERLLENLARVRLARDQQRSKSKN